MRSTTLRFSLIAALIFATVACLPPDETDEDQEGNTSNTTGSNSTSTATTSTTSTATTSTATTNTTHTSSTGDDSCEYAFDGECDEPEFCPEGTDTTDCNGTSTGGTSTGGTSTQGVVIPGGDSYTVGNLDVFVPELVVIEGSTDFEIDSVSFAFSDPTRALVGGWITNVSEEDLCSVRVRDTTCTTDSDLLIADCMQSFVDGAPSITDQETGETTKTCLRPGQRAPFMSIFEPPSDAEGQTIVRVELSITASSETILSPASNLVLDDEPVVFGSENFRVEGIVTNAGDTAAILARNAGKILIFSPQDHLLAFTYTRSFEDGQRIEPGESVPFETSRIRDLTVNDDFGEVRVVINWDDAL